MYIRVKLRGFVSSCRWMVASPPWRRGPQVRAPWHHGGHGAVDVVGPVALPGRTSGRGDKECTQIGENGLSEPFWGICVVAPSWAGVGAKECTQIGENGPSEPFWGICVHCCAVVGRRGSKGVYTDRRKRPYGAVLGHLCTLLRREPRRVERRPRSPWRAGAGAAASLASSLRRSPTQTSEEPNGAWLALTIIAVVIGCTVSSFHSPYGSGQRLVLLGYTG